MAEEQFVIGGFEFDNYADYKAAQEDVQKIELINRELDVQDPEVAVRLYNDIRDGIITFNGPIGKKFVDHVGDIVANRSVGLLEDHATIENAEGQAKSNRLAGLLCILAAVVVLGIFGYAELNDYLSAKRLANLSNVASAKNGTENSSNKGETDISNGTAIADKDSENSEALSAGRVGKWDAYVDESTLTMLPEMAELYGQNPDIIGWLYIDGTKIDYPVMQTKDDPNYYLRRDFYGESDTAGTLFMDHRCDYVNATTNTIIYGHNMKNLSMFGTLKYFLEDDFYQEHRIINFKTLYEEREYEIVAIGLSEVEGETNTGYKYYDFIEAYTADDFNEFSGTIQQHSVRDEAIDISKYDDLLTLSTCNSYTEDGRLFIVAKRVK